MAVIQLLLIEDNPDIVTLIRDRLPEFGMDVELTVGTDCAQGKSLLLGSIGSAGFQTILLDVNLPDGNGFEFAKEMRAAGITAPIIILTARKELELVTEALDNGADDYVTKPFSVPELFARIRAVLRRSEPAAAAATEPNEEQVFQFGDCTLRVLRREFYRGQEQVSLTVSEFELLLLFVQNSDRVLSREDIIRQVWGYHSQSYENNVNSHITRLRKKLTADENLEKYIKTVWGVGYRFAAENPISEKPVSEQPVPKKAGPAIKGS